ncbi:hypothetical protein [Amycolatopsis sp. NPDC003861]
MSNSDIFGLVGLVFSVVGIPLTFILARRGRKRPLLRSIVGFEILASPDDGAFDGGFMRTLTGEPITKISRTSVAIWNHQGDTVRGTDVVPIDKVRLQLEDGDFPLQVRILSWSRSQNRLVVQVDENNSSAINIEFDFLDAGDGGVFEVIHQGGRPPVLGGTIRGSRMEPRSGTLLSSADLANLNKPWYKKKKRLLARFLPLLLLIPVGVFTFIASTAVAIPDRAGNMVDQSKFQLGTLEGQRVFAERVFEVGKVTHSEPDNVFKLILLMMFLFALTLSALMVWGQRTRFPHSIVKNVAGSETVAGRAARGQGHEGAGESTPG